MGMIVPIQGKMEEECLETLQALKENPHFPRIHAVELRYDLLERHVEPLSDFLRKSREEALGRSVSPWCRGWGGR